MNIKILAREINEMTKGLYQIRDLVVIDNDYSHPYFIDNDVDINSIEKLKTGKIEVTQAEAFEFFGIVEKSKVENSNLYRIKNLKVEHLNYEN